MGRKRRSASKLALRVASLVIRTVVCVVVLKFVLRRVAQFSQFGSRCRKSDAAVLLFLDELRVSKTDMAVLRARRADWLLARAPRLPLAAC